MAKALGVNQSTVVRKMQKYMETPEEEAEETGNV
jgi:DNA-directed RNA polymerase specialized sigma54-like protein